MILAANLKVVGRKTVIEIQKLTVREGRNGLLYWKLAEIVETIDTSIWRMIATNIQKSLESKYLGIKHDSRYKPGAKVSDWMLEEISGVEAPACRDWAKERSV